MSEKKCNHCIECDVTECRHHDACENYCTLNTVKIGTHEGNPTVDSCTDCKSFKR